MAIPFPPILVINLAQRTDRWEAIQEDFAKRGWPQLNRIEAIRGNPGWHGATLSHTNCIRVAKENNLPWVLILEDDCLPTEDALQRFQDLLPSLWERRDGWDIFMGGLTGVTAYSIVQRSPPIINADGMTAHFCLIHQASYDKFIGDLSKAPIFIDKYYGEDPSVRMFCTVPNLAVQKPGISDIVIDSVDYTICFEDSNKALSDFLINNA